MEQNEKNKVEGSTLYLVGTPIGNLSDMTERAKKVLDEVDFIAAEDTRNSMKLLSCYGIHKELVSYYEHNKRQSGERIIARLLSGESCALITDAGMPAISDPGEDLVKLCSESGITVKVVPGPSACVSALALSGLVTSRFTFEGFLPAAKGDRKKRLANAARLLAMGASVAEASELSGFPDYSNFISIFKKTYGMTPLEYKKSKQKQSHENRQNGLS